MGNESSVVLSSDLISRSIAQRAPVIATFKGELIGRLNLPFTPEDLYEGRVSARLRAGPRSVDALEIVLCIESCFKIKIPDQNAAILRSINTVVDYVLEQQGQKGGAA